MSRVDETFRHAVLAMQAGQLAAAEGHFRKTLRRQPRHVGALNLLGILLQQSGRLEDAEHFVGLALTIDASSDAAFYNHGLILQQLKRPAEALQQFNRALELNPSVAETWNSRGTAFNDLRKHQAAVADFDRAIAINPNYPEAFFNRANALAALKSYEAALASYRRALALDPALAEPWIGCGNVLHALKRHAEAAEAFAALLKKQPQYPFAKGMLLHQKMLMCDWRELDKLVAEIERDVALGRLSAEPFGWPAASHSPRSLHICAKLFSANRFAADGTISPRRSPGKREKIRIAYLSDALRQQATLSLLVGALELYDKSRFEIFGFDNGWDDQSETRRRIVASMQEMVDITSLDDRSVAAAVRDREIDILVHLNGWFGDGRTGVFAQRPAPIQVNYLGFPATMGASYIDYIIADGVVIPPGHEEFYSEKIVYLPGCYQPNDRKRSMANRDFDRREFDLPSVGFVFCCFNNSFKITSGVFDHWMRILRETSGSVLWLLEHNEHVSANLKREAARRSVDPDRLIFTKLIDGAKHLARHRLADLFLDTLPYNAHTTASDALWAGLPVLTQIGTTFPGRVAASLLTAVGLPELIAPDAQAYERLAVELAGNAQKMTAIREKLASNLLTTPLFDTALYARQLDAAYAAMFDRYRSGLAPDHIYIRA
jgi:predicted O-linked N-acetylglucosamine transferase (SPINDLY family)